MRACLLACLLVGCGGDDGGSVEDAAGVDGLPRDAALDAPPDAPTAVRRVPCIEPVDTTITTEPSGQPYAYVPESITISVGEVVKFAPGPLHNVVPHTSLPSDPGLNSGPTGEERCFQFTMIGDFHFHCSPHPTTTGLVRVK